MRAPNGHKPTLAGSRHALAVFAMTGCLLVVAWSPRPAAPSRAQSARAAADDDRAFEALDVKGRALGIGLSAKAVAGILGPASTTHAWKDLRFGNPVTDSVYRVSLSGTTAWAAVFVNGCLDAFGRQQQSALFYRYGRPGFSAPPLNDPGYRFTAAGTNVCVKVP